MHGHSGSIGSLTFTTISARPHTSAALGTSVPPAARYSSSANPEPSPAPCSTRTVCPSPTSDSTPAGTSATRFSAVLISLGTPTIMHAPSYVLARRLCVTPLSLCLCRARPPSAAQDRRIPPRRRRPRLPSARLPSPAPGRGSDTARRTPQSPPNDTSLVQDHPETSSADPASVASPPRARARRAPHAPD